MVNLLAIFACFSFLKSTVFVKYSSSLFHCLCGEVMSDNESITASTDTQESSTTKSTTGSEGDSDQGYVATANCFAYDNEPLARPDQVVESNPGADGILPFTLDNEATG